MTQSASTLAETTWANLSSAMATLKLVEDLRWASPVEIKKSLESAFTETFGTKEDYNKANAAASKASKSKAATKPAANANGSTSNAQASTSTAPVTNMFEEGFLAALHPVGGNPQINERLRQEHLKATGGLVHTRFPPEPNGESVTLYALKTCLTLEFVILDFRLPTHRSFEGHRNQLRLRSVPQRPLLLTLRRHKSRSRRAGLHR